jgi:hypothetical protein
MSNEYTIIERDFEFNNISRYYKCDIYRNELIEFLDTYIPNTIRVDENDVYMNVTSEYHNRLDLVAYDCYMDSNLWWVIAEANNIMNPCMLDVGTRIRVPGLRSLWGYRGVINR